MVRYLRTARERFCGTRQTVHGLWTAPTWLMLWTVFTILSSHSVLFLRVGYACVLSACRQRCAIQTQDFRISYRIFENCTYQKVISRCGLVQNSEDHFILRRTYLDSITSSIMTPMFAKQHFIRIDFLSLENGRFFPSKILAENTGAVLDCA